MFVMNEIVWLAFVSPVGSRLCVVLLLCCLLQLKWNETKWEKERRQQREKKKREQQEEIARSLARALANSSNSYQQPYNSTCVSNTNSMCMLFFLSFCYFFSTVFFTFLKRKFSSKWWVRQNTFISSIELKRQIGLFFDTENYIFEIWIFQGF